MRKKINMKKGVSHKTIGIAAIAFAVLFVGGVVFAATSGVLQINGSVDRGANVDLDFVSVSCSVQSTEGIPAGGGVSSTGIGPGNYNCGISTANRPGTNGANDILNWAAFLASPGSTVTFTFSIQNVGAVDAVLNAVNIDTTATTGFGLLDGTGTTTPGQISITGSGLTIPQQTITVGSITGPYTYTVTWPAGDATATSSADFSASLNYSQAP
jgi:hypothetical protein